jgi:hypothetical protein
MHSIARPRLVWTTLLPIHCQREREREREREKKTVPVGREVERDKARRENFLYLY